MTISKAFMRIYIYIYRYLYELFKNFATAPKEKMKITKWLDGRKNCGRLFGQT